nr:glycoside hydrolase family 15 protein [Chloroflexota bacterium]
MALRIEDYALIGDTHTAGLVGIDGSIDWLCLPRFDAGACFSALLGTERHGRWLVAPRAGGRAVRRRYRPGTLILETDFETPDGAVRVIDLMPPRSGAPDVVRLVVGLRGRVAMQMQLILRFDYGGIVPWVREVDGGLCAVGGPDAVCLHTPVETRGEDLTTVAEFSVGEGERVPFVLTWFPSHEEAPAPTHAEEALTQTADWWRDWSGRSRYRGGWQEAVDRSLITLKALTYAPTGGIVAAATTSLPEWIGGVRNWDYRFCWLRDAAFTLYALSLGGYNDEARAWRDWLLRALAGDPPRLQALYGPAGERRLTEIELPWLPGYEDSSPVRIGNGAADQFQLDVYGETVDALHQGRLAGIDPKPAAWSMERRLVDFVEDHWQDPDEGIWEVRGPRRHFTHSKVMAWVAVDRSVRAVERFGLEGPVDQWRALRA